MKITLTETFIDDLMSMPQESANQVLNTCRELMKLDNDAIEQYVLPDDAPLPLRDVVANMKKRAAAARRRRERREALAQATPAAVSPTPAVEATTVNPELAEAINLLFSDTAITTSEHHALMHKLVVFITERITPTSQPTPPDKKPCRKRRRRNRKRRRH